MAQIGQNAKKIINDVKFLGDEVAKNAGQIQGVSADANELMLKARSTQEMTEKSAQMVKSIAEKSGAIKSRLGELLIGAQNSAKITEQNAQIAENFMNVSKTLGDVSNDLKRDLSKFKY